MKIIQTFWSHAFMDRLSVGYNGGWLERKYNYMSYALSCLLLKRLYPKVELITDDAGKSILIDHLQLPYDRVSLSLNDLNDYSINLWSMAKLHACSIQEEPFLHVDGDFFLFERPGPQTEQAPLLIANKIRFYAEVYAVVLDYMKDLVPAGGTEEVGGQPKPLSEGPVLGYNPGLWGGHHSAFLSGFARDSLSLFDQHLDIINRDIGFITGDPIMTQYAEHPFFHVNTIIESYLFDHFAKAHQTAVTPVFEDRDTSIPDPYPLLGTEARLQYSQPLSGKRSAAVCRQLEYRLSKTYPDQYHIILTALKECKV